MLNISAIYYGVQVDMQNFAQQRKQMIDYQLRARGLHDQAVINAIDAVAREAFVSTQWVDSAYNDTALPIAARQTISQPYIVAIMTAALELKSTDRVLEVGTGSGYAAAVMAQIAKQVYTVERHKTLADSARTRLKELGYHNIEVLLGDGTLGWPQYAPFDAIVVTAGGPMVPETLKQQLAVGACLVIPVGTALHSQVLLRIRRTAENEFEEEDLCSVSFVPLIGAAGWDDGTTLQTL